MLEIMAIKIFGHAKARAAIYNDSDFYKNNSNVGSIINKLIDGIQNGITDKKNDIFNIYVDSDRIQYDAVGDQLYNDIDTAHNFNFNNTSWSFPVYLKGSLLDSISSSITGNLNNGPIVGGNTLINGSYNIPILVIFKQQ